MSSRPTCARHPDVETRLACSSCDTPICPDCGREAAVGFKCPDCAAHADATTSGRTGSGSAPALRLGGQRSGPRTSSTGDGVGAGVGARAGLIGVAAAFMGGVILWPVLHGGMFFLLSSGVVGWGVARAVYWATEERNSPAIRIAALAMAGLSVAIAMALAGLDAASGGLAFLAYPAAVYGGWIVVRQR